MTYNMTYDKTFEKDWVKMIYLDYAATTPISDEALYVFGEASKSILAMLAACTSLERSKPSLNMCRKTWRTWSIVKRMEFILRAAGRKRINLLFYRSFSKSKPREAYHWRKRNTLPCIIYTNNWKMKGLQWRFAVDRWRANFAWTVGTSDPADDDSCIDQFVNGETGMIQPVEEIGKLLKQHGVIFHADCVQAFRNVDIDVRKYIDALSITSHKIYGPKGPV